MAANNAVGTGWASTVDIQLNLNAGEAPNLGAANFTGTIASDSTASGAAPKLTVKLNSLPVPLPVGTRPVGTRVVLFLEDDFQVPDSIPASSIYFVANSPASVATGSGAPVYATEAPEIDTDDYFDDDKDDVSITVRIPDMCARNSTECAGPNGLEQGQELTMVILGSSGIKNPSEAGTHTVAYDVLGFDDGLPGRIERLMDNGIERSAAAGSIQKRQGVYLSTLAKISLSATKGNRGDMLTVNGSGFKNGVTASAYVAQRKAARYAVAEWWNTLNCDSRKTEMGGGQEFCFHYTLNASAMTYTVTSSNKAASDKVFARHLCKQGIIPAGTEAGSATVGSDDRVAIPFEVSVPTFKPGNDNLICVEDGEGRTSSNVEGFELTPFIRMFCYPDEVSISFDTAQISSTFDRVSSILKTVEMELIVNDIVIEVIKADTLPGRWLRDTSISSDGWATVRFKLPRMIHCGMCFEVKLRNLEVKSDKCAEAPEAPVSEALAPLGESLMAVFHFDRISRDWLFYDSHPQFAGFNTLETLVPGEPYWVMVTHDVDVVLGGKPRSLKCARGNCWNLMVW